EAGLDDEVGRVLLEAVAGLHAEEAHRLLAVDIPPVAGVLAYDARRPLGELLVDPVDPQVRRFDDVAIRRDHRLKRHVATVWLPTFGRLDRVGEPLEAVEGDVEGFGLGEDPRLVVEDGLADPPPAPLARGPCRW